MISPTPRMRDKVILALGDALCLFVVTLCWALGCARTWVSIIRAWFRPPANPFYEKMKELEKCIRHQLTHPDVPHDMGYKCPCSLLPSKSTPLDD